MIDVICYGIVCLDIIWRVSRLPQPGGYAPIRDEAVLIGGEAANTALALKRWGASVHLIGNAPGEDERGEQLKDLLRREFSPSDTLTLKPSPGHGTTYCTCIATDDGHRTMFGRGFDTLDCPALTPEAAASARLFTIDSTGHLEAGRDAVSVAAEAGIPVIAMDCETLPEVCEKADTLLVSGERLAFRAVGESMEDLLGWAKETAGRHGANVIVTRGGEGCIAAYTDGSWERQSAFAVSEVVDSTGCGDVFRAGYLFGRLRGWERGETLRFASAAAALNCGAMGAWPGVKDLAATQEFMHQNEPAL